jgi:phosphate transport system substrate-binding protein
LERVKTKTQAGQILAGTKKSAMKTNARNERFNLRRIKRGSAATILIAGILAGCSEKSESPSASATSGNPAAKRDKIVIKGSNTVGEELAPRLVAEFKKDHPNAKFDLESKGTGTGFSGLVSGACDIAAASRPIDPGEQELAQTRGIQMNEHAIGAYSVAVVVNAANPVASLTTDQVRDLFTGKVQNWKDVGGPDTPVHLFIRDPVSGTHKGFAELAMGNKPYAADNLSKFTDYAQIVEAVGKDAGGIGYASFQLAAKSGAKPVSIGGLAPVAASVNDGKYPYARVLHLYTNKAAEPADARAFIEFVMSARGQAVLDEMGFVPHK